MHPLVDFWRSVETLHSAVYFVPDARERLDATGLRGWWMGYVATRAGALGTPSSDVVVATFHGFAPRLVERALPDAWRLADVEEVLAARVAMARDALAPGLAGHDVERLAGRLGEVVARADVAGKPLAAAERSRPVPDDAVGALWRHATVLRELRGDAHVSVLVTAGLGGAASNALQVALGRVPAEQRERRGWTEDEWGAAVEDLQRRGWLDAEGAATDTGRAARERLEDATDRAVDAALDTEATAHAVAVEPALLAAARSVVATGAIAFPNPVGATAP